MMNFRSTRSDECVSPSYALLHGLARDGGLYVPEQFPDKVLQYSDLAGKNYQEIAAHVLGYFFTNFSKEERKAMIAAAYNDETFTDSRIVPLHSIDTDLSISELFHGRTLAFKDLALSLFPHMLTAAKEQEQEHRDILILTATSGDTGKAALEGFKDVPGTNIMVFYPSQGVSPMQKQQMQKQEGKNVKVSAIYGNFDDAQSFLKRVFTNQSVNDYADEKGVLFSSANSINIGRLFPQIVYYVSTYVSLVESGCIDEGEAFDVVVPTGNFGNILAGYFAKRMGVPIGKLICASNKNKVLADFFETGVYDMNRTFYTTASPSMDILLSSNFERFLFYVAGGDSQQVARWETDLQETGRMAVSPEQLAALQKDFSGGWIDDVETKAVINHVYNDFGYLLDPHTAVAYGVYLNQRHLPDRQGSRHTVIMATAHPFKFPPVICQALALEQPADPYAMLAQISDCTGMSLPGPLAELQRKPVRFGDSINKEDMKEAVLSFVDTISSND
jgi:threonine synthase